MSHCVLHNKKNLSIPGIKCKLQRSVCIISESEMFAAPSNSFCPLLISLSVLLFRFLAHFAFRSGLPGYIDPELAPVSPGWRNDAGWQAVSVQQMALNSRLLFMLPPGLRHVTSPERWLYRGDVSFPWCKILSSFRSWLGTPALSGTVVLQSAAECESLQEEAEL